MNTLNTPKCSKFYTSAISLTIKPLKPFDHSENDPRVAGVPIGRRVGAALEREAVVGHLRLMAAAQYGAIASRRGRQTWTSGEVGGRRLGSRSARRGRGTISVDVSLAAAMLYGRRRSTHRPDWLNRLKRNRPATVSFIFQWRFRVRSVHYNPPVLALIFHLRPPVRNARIISRVLIALGRCWPVCGILWSVVWCA